MKTYIALGLLVLALAAPASARLWKPTQQQIASDYSLITHNKGAEGRVAVQWLASPTATTPVFGQVLDKYVVISVSHVRTQPSGGSVWDDVQGVQVTDGAGQALKEVPPDEYPPTLIGLFATVDAIARQASQGKAKPYWAVYQAGSVSACTKGKLQVAYDGETYSWDSPFPGCPK